MERIKELRAKAEAGEITDEEKVELEGLEEAEVVAAEDAAAQKAANLILAKMAEGIKKDTVEVKNVEPATKTGFADLSKEKQMLHWLKSLGAKNIKAAAVMDETNMADIVTPEDFIKELDKMVVEYGVTRRNATIYSVNSNTYHVNKLTGEVTVAKVGEKAKIGASNLDTTPVTISLDKYAGIALLTDELDEDSVINLWNEMSESFGRAFAESEDTLTFAEVLANGTQVVMGTGLDTFAEITFGEIRRLVDAVHPQALKNGKFYLHRSILSILGGLKDKNDRPLLADGVNGADAKTLYGYPVELVEVMPTSAESADDTAFIAFGDLKKVTFIEKAGTRFKVLSEGTVTVDGTEVNLGEQDCQALRAIRRYNVGMVRAEALAVLVTAHSA